MYCRHCGNKIANVSKFCNFCGKDVEEAQAINEQKSLLIEPQSIKNQMVLMFSSIRSTLSEPGEESTLEVLEVGFKKLISEFNSEAITHCIEKYIEAELDYTTPGSRGIGRMTANIPRFGAYFKKPLLKLSSQELDKLYFLIQDLCIRGYLNSAIYVKWPARSDKLSNKTLLFKEWIPKIYITNPYNVSSEVWDIIKINSMFTIIEVHDFMRKHGMERNGIFNKASKFLSGDKVNEILEYYIVAGYTLRAVEEGYY